MPAGFWKVQTAIGKLRVRTLGITCKQNSQVDKKTDGLRVKGAFVCRSSCCCCCCSLYGIIDFLLAWHIANHTRMEERGAYVSITAFYVGLAESFWGNFRGLKCIWQSNYSLDEIMRTWIDYSVFLWIPPVLFPYPEIKATEVRFYEARNSTSVAFISGFIMKLGESKETHWLGLSCPSRLFGCLPSK